jgi:hypothetical protein
MDFSSTLQDENLFEESSGRNEYKDWPSKDYPLIFMQNSQALYAISHQEGL